ncbi:MAG: FliH/SctL family protein [Lautropia sp.]
MSSSERAARVVRGGDWQPLTLSRLTGSTHPGRAVVGRAAGKAADRAGGGPAADPRVAAAFGDGIAEGRRLAAADAERRDRLAGIAAHERWTALTGAFEHELRTLEGTLADRVLELALTLARSIACREIATAPDAIEAVLADAMRSITGGYRHLEISANPADCERIRGWLAGRSGDATLTVRADGGIAHGGCLIRADDATLDATLATRIRRTFEALGVDAPEATVEPGATADGDGAEAGR